MNTTTNALRRSLSAVFAASAVGGVAVAVLGVPSATAATDPCAASELARTIGSVATSMGTYLDAHPETNQASDDHFPAAGRAAVAGIGQGILRRQPTGREGHAAVAAAAGQLVHSLQAAGQPAPADRDGAGRAAAGRRPTRWFARNAANGTDHGRSRCGVAGVAVPGFGGHAGRRSAARTRDNPHPLAPGDVCSGAGEAAELRFPTFSWLVGRKARKSAPFLLSF